MSSLLLFGDSITAGRIGIAYRRYLPLSSEVHGIEGDTWSSTTRRALRHLAKGVHIGTRTLVIQAGANDLLIPHMMRHNPLWGEAGKALAESNAPLLDDDDRFMGAFRETLRQLEERDRRLVTLICAIPPLGEELDSPLNKRRTERNEAMRKTIGLYDRIIWCDIATPLEHLVRESGLANSPYLLDDPSVMERDAREIGTDEEKAQNLSRSRNLVITIDGVHPNATGARSIAESIVLRLPW